jgi:CdiI N-terminal domain
MKMTIHIIDRNPQIIYGLPCAKGEIIIGDFRETFEMPLATGSLHDYERQWHEGIERIQTYIQSCLITNVQGLDTKAPLVNWWLLYKEGSTIFIRNQMLFGKIYREKVGNNPFTLNTCYQYIQERIAKKDVSEWIVSIEDL